MKASFVAIAACLAACAANSSTVSDGDGATSAGAAGATIVIGAGHGGTVATAAGSAGAIGSAAGNPSGNAGAPSGDDGGASGDDGGAGTTSDGGASGDDGSAGTAGGDDTSAGGSTANPSADCPTGVLAIVYAHGPSTLYGIDPDTLALTTIGHFSGCGGSEMIDIAVNRDGDLYGTTDGTFVQIDPKTAKCTQLAQADDYPNSLSFVPKGTVDPDVEALVGYNGSDYVRIDPMTGAKTKIGELKGGQTSSGDIVSVVGGGTYLTILGDNDDELIQVDPATGDEIASLGSTNHQEVYGLAYWNGLVFGFDAGGEGFTVDVTNGTIKNVASGAPTFYGAGSTTCARLPTVK